MLIDKVDTCRLIDIGLRFYAVHHIHLDDLEVGLGSFVFEFWLMFL